MSIDAVAICLTVLLQPVLAILMMHLSNKLFNGKKEREAEEKRLKEYQDKMESYRISQIQWDDARASYEKAQSDLQRQQIAFDLQRKATMQ
jgi:uncharacterized membrane protein (DUF106 family)